MPGARAAYLAYRAGAETARRLPPPLGRPLARVASRAMVVRVARPPATGRASPRAASPTATLEGAALDRATAAVFANYARYWHEMFRLGPGSGAELQHDVRAARRRAPRRRDRRRPGRRSSRSRTSGTGTSRARGSPGAVVGVTVVAETGRAARAVRVVRRRRAGRSAWTSSPLGPDAGRAVLRALRPR